MNAPSHPLPHSRQPFSRDWQELMDTIPAPSHPELCVLCWCPQHPSRTELRVPTLVICFTRHSLLAASTYSLFFPPLPHSSSYWCFLGAPSNKLAFVSRSASGKTKLKQLAQLAITRTFLCLNDCWLYIHKGLSWQEWYLTLSKRTNLNSYQI